MVGTPAFALRASARLSPPYGTKRYTGTTYPSRRRSQAPKSTPVAGSRTMPQPRARLLDRFLEREAAVQVLEHHFRLRPDTSRSVMGIEKD